MVCLFSLCCAHVAVFSSLGNLTFDYEYEYDFSRISLQVFYYHVTYTLFFLYKNLFYKNVEAEIDADFKNMLRTYLA